MSNTENVKYLNVWAAYKGIYWGKVIVLNVYTFLKKKTENQLNKVYFKTLMKE